MDCGVNSSDHSCESYMRTWTDYTYDHYEHEDGECYRVGRYTTTNVFCRACEKMDSYTLYDPDYRQQVPHEFSDYGVCFNCGYYNDGGNCSHADAYIDYYVDTVDELQETGLVNIVDNGDGTHSYTKYQMPHYYCPDCGYAYLGEVEAVEGYTEKPVSYTHLINAHVGKGAFAGHQKVAVPLGDVRFDRVCARVSVLPLIYAHASQKCLRFINEGDGDRRFIRRNGFQ